VSDFAQLPVISQCAAAGCSYNDQAHCHAAAVTIGQTSACITFIPLSVKGDAGLAGSHVGACQRADCTHNTRLECTAPAVVVGPAGDAADCLTFAAR
jgi:hypothetical protein